MLLVPDEMVVPRYIRLHNEFKNSVLQHYSGKDAADVIRNCVDGSIKIFDAMFIDHVIQQTKPRRILEVGSFLGFSTRWIAESSRLIGSSITSIDPRVRHRVFDRLKEHFLAFNTPHADRIRCVDGYFSRPNYEMFMFDLVYHEPKWSARKALEYLESIPTISSPFDEFDFAFVDGDHSFAATIENVSLVAEMMPSGGLICIHDAISWPDVTPAILDLCKRDPKFINRGVMGEGFKHWTDSHHMFEHLKNQPHMFGSMCDGIGLVEVAPRN
jgi:predicted O-methyltransferase YrrM